MMLLNVQSGFEHFLDNPGTYFVNLASRRDREVAFFVAEQSGTAYLTGASFLSISLF